ncbi:hypothetical protein ACH5RR_031846 [Cinchona calisaya]|uniref:Uncharacterized protein n=1 Tax=Cinchona calisaya TaxID=153742 RepID=A0ABD2YJ51_9GENT
MTAASSFEWIDSALGELRKCYYKYIMLTPFGRSSDDIFFNCINQTKTDWDLLKMLWELLLRKKMFFQQNSGQGGGGDLGESLVFKIESAADKFGRFCVVLVEETMKKKKNSAKELEELASVFQSKSNDLIIAEIREAIDQWSSSSCCTFQVNSHPPPHDYNDSFWTSFVDSVMSNLRSIGWCGFLNDDADRGLVVRVSAFNKEVKMLSGYIRFAAQALKSKDNAAAGAGDHMIYSNDNIVVDAFLNHVASVIVRTAIQSCNYCFNYKPDLIRVPKVWFTKLLEDLQHEIDSTTNPEFMDLHLKFLIALNKLAILLPSPGQSSYRMDITYYFCSFFQTNKDLENELKSLVTLFINNQLEQQEEDSKVESFFAEISALLVEVRQHSASPYPPCPSELLIKICLVKAEIFLKEQVRHHNSTFLDGGLDGILESMRRFYTVLPQEKMEYGKQRLVLMEQVATEVASLHQPFEADKNITEFMVKNSLLHFLLKIVTFKAESFLAELLRLKSSSNAVTFMANEKVQIEFLHQQLKLLNLILVNQIMEDMEGVEKFFTPIETFSRRITCFSYSYLPHEIPKNMIRKMTFYFFELLDDANHIRLKLKEIGPQLLLPNFPRTYKLGFIDFLVRNLGDLLKHDPESIAPVKHHIEEIQLHLKSLSSFLMKVSESDIEHSELKDLCNHVIDIAYKVEFVVDSIEINAQWKHFFWFYDLQVELRLADKQAFRIHATLNDDKVQNITHVSCDMLSRDRTPAIDAIMVELRNDEERVIVDQLTRGSKHRDIISIVGMPGIGKTTLARKVYNNQNVINHFHRRAWCNVSQVYEKRQLFLEILHDIHGLTNEIHQMSEEDLESELRQFLLKNKYLIVMDDVWDIGAWNDLVNSFPDDVNGSRILITSRLRDVALKIIPFGNPHTLRLFSDDESWKLLENKIFQAEGCPDELLLVGQQIAQQCKGLPLAVVAIAGVLQRTGKGKEWWEKIAESLSSEIMKDPDARCTEILELSYKHLPGHLKACFLYLGVFPQQKDIHVNKLICYWLAEGFIKKAESKCLEDVAEDWLMDLIDRSLVIVTKRRSNGKVKECRLHDLLHDLCQSKAKEENFLQLVTRCDEPYASFPSSDYGFEFDFDHPIEHVTYSAYRLCIFLKRIHFVESRPSGLGTRSIIFGASTDPEPSFPYDISFIYQNFKFLRVLDLECINLGTSFPIEIGLLVQLRYLGIGGYMRSFPQSIENLRKLETFVVNGFRGKIVLPDTIWCMTSLRHLHVNTHVSFNLDDTDLDGCFHLKNLVSLSRPSLSCGEDTEKIMKRFPNLCKLRCIFFESWDSSTNCNQFPRLNFLAQLESLNIFYYGRALKTSEFVFPLNLKKLTLSNFRLPWNHISAIGRLPNLQVLKLVSGAFEGRIWDMREEEFQELIFLKLDTLDVTQWNASSDHLPKLQRLVLKNCKNLEKVPYEFAEINTLEIIEVLWCGQSAEESANEIGEVTGEVKVLTSR